jgi:hypothetical protein
LARFPVIIGATGLAGASALRAALEARGYYMGLKIDENADALDLIPFFNRHTAAVLSRVRRLDYELAELPEDLRRSALTHLEAAMAAYLGPYAGIGGPWGIKLPRAIYMLPFFRELFPDMLLIQMIRDGRDLARDRYQLQLQRNYEPVFGEAPAAPLEVAAARLWAKANIEAADWSRKHLPDRHLVVKVEELQADPDAALAQVLDFLQWSCAAGELVALAALVRGEGELALLRAGGPAEAALETAAAPGLARFGYP